MREIPRAIAGAFVFSADNRLLLIKTAKGGVYQDAWIIPGGGVDEGETPLEAVIRELAEEVGITITAEQAEPIKGEAGGESVKTLPDGEEVLVRMKFLDFAVRLPQAASDISLQPSDEIAEAAWFEAAEVPLDSLGGGTKAALRAIGFLP